jgi:adenylate cyclase
VPYYKLVEESGGTHPDLAGKAVFVGFSEQFQPEQKDGFYTVFSQPDGLDISGVEIAATTFANLHERRQIKPLAAPAYYGFIIGWGMIIGVLLMVLPGVSSVMAAVLLAVLCTSLARYWFISDGTWLPLLIPIVVQLPVALTGALLWRFLYTQRERHKLRSAFGYFLPGRVVDELIQGTVEIADKGQLVNGICLATDAEQYTRLSEDLDPSQLRNVLNRYFQNVFEPVRRRGGIVSDVVGDAMLAIWATTGPDLELRQNACLAALEIMAATEQFNRLSPETPLPTRIGLHRGEMVLGSVGAGEHYEYRAVGDIVNAASRIENLNKQLGTRLLVSTDVIEGVDGILTRELGQFRLVGKRHPLVIHELICRQQHANLWIEELVGKFAEALDLFKVQRWHDALGRFCLIEDQYGDGPAHFYVGMCEQYLSKPSTAIHSGIINLSRK